MEAQQSQDEAIVEENLKSVLENLIAEPEGTLLDLIPKGYN